MEFLLEYVAHIWGYVNLNGAPRRRHVDSHPCVSNYPQVPPAGRYNDEQGKRETGQCRPSVVCFGDVVSVVRTKKLTPDSIQEALRMFLQPIKNDDPQVDFYTMYKRETTEYDTEYMQKYNEDLNTTLIFVGFSSPFIAARR